MQMSIFDYSTTHNLRQEWYPLEVVLGAWLEMIKVGKVQAVPQQVEPRNGKYAPWVMVPYSRQQLDNTIRSFHDLVESIESRMPPGSICPREVAAAESLLANVQSSQPSLVSKEVVDAACIPHGFARSFLLQARRPCFRYIAPGLSLPTMASLTSQPFGSIDLGWPEDDPHDPTSIPPIVLFPSSKRYNAWADRHTDPEDVSGSRRPFSWPYSQVQSFPAGLYFTAANRESGTEFEDSVKLVLPFPIGGFGHVRTSDGARFGENRETQGWDGQVAGRDTFADLFQIGYNPFGEMHEVQLSKVLDAWRKLVESGLWTINKDGIRGTMDVWREADRGDKWRSYMVQAGW